MFDASGMRRSQMWTAVVLAGLVVTDDQVTKALAQRAGVVLHNPAYAFGIVGGSVPVLVLGMVVTLGLFVGTIGLFAVRIGVSPVYPALIVAGMIGNTLDRIRYGAARDFIRTPFAIVNVADLAVLIGVIAFTAALAWHSLASPRRVAPVAHNHQF
jgi:lipoprotein signal peptidase